VSLIAFAVLLGFVTFSMVLTGAVHFPTAAAQESSRLVDIFSVEDGSILGAAPRVWLAHVVRHGVTVGCGHRRVRPWNCWLWHHDY